MAESISIPLRYIENLLHGIAPSWVNSRLEKLKSMLIQIQRYEDCRLLQHLTDESSQNKNDIRCFAYQIDDQLDTIYINIESYRRWVNSGIPSVIKTLALAYYKSRVLHNFRSLFDLIQQNKFVKSCQNSYVRELNVEQRWKDLVRFNPHFLADNLNFSYDFEGRLFFSNTNSYRLFGDLSNYKDKSITIIDISRHYVCFKEIYDSIPIRKYFQKFAWVSMLRRPKRIIVYRDILKQLLSNDKKKDVVGLMSMKEDQLWKELMEVLTSNKCLILLTFDLSIYDKDLVDQFDVPMESRLLVITHQKYVACKDEVYGWKLLESITFQKKKKEDLIFRQFKKIGLQLIAKCNGVPQCIIKIGGLLRENMSIDYWENVYKSLSYRSDSDYDWKIVALCYDHLSSYRLKACFLYFGQFWENDDISTEMVYQMWIAEGLVSLDSLVGEKTTTDTAEQYLAILATTFLIDVQVSKFSTARRFVLCRIDNFVKKFCLQPERLHEPFQKVNEASYGFYSSSQDGRRLSIKLDFSRDERDQIMYDIDVMFTLKNASKELRSLLIQRENGTPRIPISFTSEICKKFKLLRVLKIENFEILGGKLPKDIRTLIHLRFLSLEGSTFEELPKTLGNLQFMQTLDLRVAEIIPRGIVVPNVLWKLKELTHLYLPTSHRVPKGKDKLSLNGLNNLETLVNFDIEKVELTSLEWKSLRHIDARVHGKKSIYDVIDCINKSGEKLTETFLHVNFSGFSYGESDVPLEDVFNCSNLNHFMVNWGRCDLNEFKFPSPFSSNIIELCLKRCRIREDPMPILGKFPQLRKLVLGKKTFMGRYMTFQYYSFPALRHLEIINLPYLKELDIDSGSMSKLSYLEIIYCLRLEMSSSGIKVVRNLTELKFRMPKKFNDKFREQDANEGEYFKNVKHVPFIFLEDL